MSHAAAGSGTGATEMSSKPALTPSPKAIERPMPAKAAVATLHSQARLTLQSAELAPSRKVATTLPVPFSPSYAWTCKAFCEE